MNIRRHKQEIGFLVLIIALALIWYSGTKLPLDPEAIRKALAGFPLALSGALYVALYVVVTFFIFFSKDVFWFTGAVLFGPLVSTIFICIAEVINAFILFHLARSLGRAYVEKSVSGKYKQLDRKIGSISLFWLFIFRAAPLIPYRFLDLAAGLTKIKFKKYLVAVIFGSPIKMFWIQYILSGVGKNIFRDPSVLVDYFLRNQALMMFSFIYLILAISVIIKINHKV
jgi:uncharacterized membrane protein YdjX (TVP38/TMEM64 family)